MPSIFLRLSLVLFITAFVAACNGSGSGDDDSNDTGATSSQVTPAPSGVNSGGGSHNGSTGNGQSDNSQSDDGKSGDGKNAGTPDTDDAKNGHDDSGSDSEADDSTKSGSDDKPADKPDTGSDSTDYDSADDDAADGNADDADDTDDGDSSPDTGSETDTGDDSDDSGVDAPGTAVRIQLGDSIDQAYPRARYIANATVNNDASARSTTVVTFGQVFAEGVAPGDAHVVVTAGGHILATQTDAKAHWSDGSLRHAVITVVPPAHASGATRNLAVYVIDDTPPTPGSRLTLKDVLASDFDATLDIVENGRHYQAKARSLLQAIANRGSCPDWGRTSCKQWLAGPLASEWIVAAPLTAAGGEQTPLLRAYFNIRAYRSASGGVGNVRVDTVIENTQAYDVSPSNVTYDAHISVGSSDYDITGLTHYLNARWHRVLWSEGAPGVRVLPSTDYLQSSKAVSRYAELTPKESVLNNVRKEVAPMDRGDQTASMGNTGAQDSIGPLPRWTSTFVVSNDKRAFLWMKANDDAAGSYAFHYRDDATGRPLSIVDHPYVTIANYNSVKNAPDPYAKDLLPRCQQNCHSPLKYDIAHQPSVGYVAYLTTGDFYYLEEMQFIASYDELWSNQGYRQEQHGRLQKAFIQVRSQAWTLRAISDAAFATPDNDPMKKYFVDQIEYIVNDYLDTYVNQEGHPLHMLDGFQDVHYPFKGQQGVAFAPWQQDFFTWAMGHAAEQGVPGAKRMLDWFAPWYAGLMTNVAELDGNEFCWLEASAYTLKLRDNSDSPLYDSLGDVYRNSFPDLAGLACNSEAMRRAMANGGTPATMSAMVGYPTSPTGFPANLQPALAQIADTGQNGVAQAWQVFANRAEKPDYSNDPQFAVVSRTVQ